MLKLLFIIIKRVCLLLQTKSDSLNSISFKRNGELKQNPFLLLLDKSFWFHPTAKKKNKINKLASSVYQDVISEQQSFIEPG